MTIPEEQRIKLESMQIKGHSLDDLEYYRETKYNSNPPENQLEKITLADPNLSEKMNCIPVGYEDYDVTNTQYVEEIDGNTTGTLGCNCSKGKMYLSKSLTSTQFRTWSTRLPSMI